ncbi:MAG TPA: hypothetical protein VFC78_07990, partial [Tepidisphaeraceae bacterium]|nr:hypothetical protein [Tepidisphaeraceae bacterium]
MTGRYVYWIAGILALTAGYACWCRAPLIWDGAYQLNTMLIMQHPYVYLTRFHTWFLWWPTVWASHLTSNMIVLQTVYGLPFLLAPAIGLLLSWWIVRREAPHLILWVVFGVAAATLPGQIFVINDSIFQQHMFWPVFVGLFVPLTWPKRIVLFALAAFQFVHPLGVALLLGGALAAGGVAIVDVEHRRRLLFRAGLLALLCVMAVAKIEITNHLPQWRDTYAQQEATWTNAKQRWLDAVRGLPLDGLNCMYAAGALAQPLFKRRWRNAPPVAGILAMVFAAVASVFWIQWAARPYWGSAIDYRRWVGPLTAPFFLAGALEVFLRARRRQAAFASIAPGMAVVALEYAGPHPNPPP